MEPDPNSLHVDLDGAWPAEAWPGLSRVEARTWGPKLRYSATRAGMEEFAEFMRAHPADFILYGSGDFHHLSALWLRRQTEPFTLVSFDNHPDWDIRPPRWGCGTWLSRALEMPLLEKATIWGCGNFELEWPTRLFANKHGLRSQRLDVRPWAERLKPKTRTLWNCLTPENWRAEFAAFAGQLAGRRVYVTIDMDCLRLEDAATNWESGLFTLEDISWALREVRSYAASLHGDLCGAYSPGEYARYIQRWEARLDHPTLPLVPPEEAAARNARALQHLWPVLTGRD